jgi:centromere/kinetochore protein ZW10
MQTQSLSTLLSPGPGLQTSTNQSERQRSAAAYASVFFDRSTRSQQLIHERIQSDLPSFNSQLAAAESIRSRLHALQDNTEQLSDAISNPEVCPPSSF